MTIRDSLVSLTIILVLIALALSLPKVQAAHGPDSGEKASKINASIVKSQPLKENRRTAAILRMEHEGTHFPVMPEELEVVHTEKVHLLIIEPSLSDYHHEHPLPMNKPGEYIFTMTPKTPCGYRVWADIDTVHSPQQYVISDIEGLEDCSDMQISKVQSMSFEDHNYRFSLEMDTPTLEVGQDTILKLIVREHDGAYVEDLEPIMGTFAHMVGFYDDYNTIAHIHPMGEEPTRYSDRGGPILKFHFRPETAGFIKLFAQVKIKGYEIYAPFGVFVGGSMAQSMPSDNEISEAQPEIKLPGALMLPQEVKKQHEEESVPEPEETTISNDTNSLGNMSADEAAFFNPRPKDTRLDQALDVFVVFFKCFIPAVK